MRLSKSMFYPYLLLALIIVLALYAIASQFYSSRPHSDDVRAVISKVDSAIETLQPAPESGNTHSTGDVTLPPPLGEESVIPQPDELSGNHGEADGTEMVVAESEPTADLGVSDDLTEKREEQENTAVAEVSREQLWHTWEQARQAAWQGDFSTAIEHYQTVITLQPDNYDAYGEMGNLMWRIGDREGAADAYYHAAILLNKAHYSKMAWHLLNVISTLSPKKAESLYQELMRP